LICFLVGVSHLSAGLTIPASDEARYEAIVKTTPVRPAGWPDTVPENCYPQVTHRPEGVCLHNQCQRFEWREAKSGMTALLLQLFLGGCGAAYWYFGYYTYAVLMMCLILAPCIFICAACCCGAGLFAAFNVVETEAQQPIYAGQTDAPPDYGAQMGSGQGAASGAGSGSGRGSNDVMAVVAPMMYICVVLCSVCSSMGASIWAIVVIVQVAENDLMPQQANTCLKPM